MLEIKPFRPEDEKKAIQFALKGLDMKKYYTEVPHADRRALAGAAGFWRSMKIEATGILAAYEGDELRGILLYQMKGEPRCSYSLLDDLLQKWFFFYSENFLKEDWTSDDTADEKLLEKFQKEYDPDGCILLLLADPGQLKKGIGRFLVTEFEKKYPGKLVYLFTDTDCCWQFYERLGFTRYADMEVTYQEENGRHILKMIYYKKLRDSFPEPDRNPGQNTVRIIDRKED